MAHGRERRLKIAEDTASENQLTIEQLAQRTGLSVRNIRSHHARGLLPPPEVRARVGYYGPEHEARLRLIRQLQEEGLKLDGIRRLLDEPRSMGEGLLRVREAASAAEEAEQPEVLSVAELEERFERGGDEGAKLLQKARKLAILSPVGKDLFEVPSPSLLAAADEAQRLGIPVEHTVDAIAEVERHATAVARRFVKLFLDDVWKPFAKEGMPEDQWPAIVDAMERTRPLAARALDAVFRQTMEREVDAALADIAKKLSEGKR